MGNLNLQFIQTDQNFQILDFYVDGNLTLDPGKLAGVQLPSGANLDKGLIINGKGPVWLYARLAGLCRDFPWIGTFDPRFGSLIVLSRIPEMPVGTMIPANQVTQYLTTVKPDAPPVVQAQVTMSRKVIAFVGPPHSGKSVLTYLTQARLKQLMGTDYGTDFFVIVACPDGEGIWSQESSPEVVRIIRHKGTFDQDFIEKTRGSLEGLKAQKRLVFVDCGGKIKKDIQAFLNLCTHAIIVAAKDKPHASCEWRGACLASGVEIVAEIESVLEPEETVLESSPLKIRFGPLERNRTGVKVPDELMAAILAGTNWEVGAD